jgi:hypothetical protein
MVAEPPLDYVSLELCSVRWPIRFAYRFGGDQALIDVPHALVAVPGTRCERVHPTRTAHVETWAPEKQYALTDIERWLDEGGR